MPRARATPKAPQASELAIVYRPLKGLQPYARNSRTHTDAQIGKIKASLAQFGWTNPILIADDEVIAGHARLQAALEMAEAGQSIPRHQDPWQAPTVDLSHLSKTDRRAYVIADNRLALDAGWDMDMLRLELDELKLAEFDVSLLGFDVAEIGNILKGNELEAPEQFGEYGEDIEVEHCCPRCGYWFSGGKTREAGAEEEQEAAAE